MSQAGQIKVTIAAEDRFSRTMASLRRDLDATQGHFGGLASAAAGASRVLGMLGVGSAVAGVTLMAGAVRQFSNDLDGLNDASDATGSTVEKLSALEDAARRKGGDLDQVVSAIVRMNQALKESDPDSPAAQALRMINVSAADLRRMDPSDALLRISSALSGYADDGDKARLVQELFGRGARELAPLLKDLAEKGQLVGSATEAQTKAAEAFNNRLNEMRTNATNAGRALVSELLPHINRVLESLSKGSLSKSIDFYGAEIKANLAGDRYATVVRQIESVQSTIDRQGASSYLEKRLKALREEADALGKASQKAAAELRRFTGGAASEPQASPSAKPSVGEIPAKPRATTTASAPKISEAQRYLEMLQRQVDATQTLTHFERLQADIARGRLDGLTPALRAQIETEARRLDQIHAQTRATREQAAALDDLIATRSRASDELDAMLNNTPEAARARLEAQRSRIASFAAANPEDETAQRQAAAATAEINRQLQELDARVKSLAPAWQQLSDYWTDTAARMEDAGTSAMRSIGDAIDTMVEGGSVSFGRLVQSILTDIAKVQVKSWIFRALGLGSGGSNAGAFAQLLGAFGGARAAGGPVAAGKTYLVGERGPELLSMGGQGGHVTPNHALRGSATTINLQPVVHIDARSDQGQVAQLVSAAMAQTQAQMWEQLRVRGLA